ncbi:MBL fold metallo-hydrolase [Megasphaera hominis]|jgi:L-ascorbate metabolism protein UlaG (beta-lactamase superfamily)|uniref:MBL fold metallo-hydrolase n=1 Tax=Megasphaera hominis TaxID=159836 RepID=A0ABR6VLI6_9FIRM|nr:MBL fold metallo-hydrolase [Megasphaera hominis]MBC3537615.1 MBL fold metallo-hydrolase [Megasphaera hominis]
MTLHVTYLGHSGFTVETDTKVLVFDYYQDDQQVVRSYAQGNKPFWFFVTHWHNDHFNRHIADFAQQTEAYIINKDVPFRQAEQDKLHTLDVYDTIHVGETIITQFGSTDEGGSFLVKTDGVSIFHAGDLNWWHWEGDTAENNENAKRMYAAELEKLDGLTVDVAFFPVDARLDYAREWGVTAFLKHVKVTQCLVPMHYFGAPWTPSRAFTDQYPQQHLWIPIHSGDSTNV